MKPKNDKTTSSVPETKDEKSISTYSEYLQSIGIACVTGSRLKQSQDKMPTYSTGSLNVDLALGKLDPETGYPGLSARSISEWVGPNQSYKTGTMLQVALSVQQRDPKYRVAIIAAEPLNTQRMKDVGLDLDRVEIFNTFHEDTQQMELNSEKGMQGTLYLINKYKEFKFVGIDSIKALWAESELIEVHKKEQELLKNQVAVRARMFNSYIKNFRANNNSDALLFLVNQISCQKIDVNKRPDMSRQGFSSVNQAFYTPFDIQVDSSGGYGLKHAADVRVECLGSPWFVKDKDDKLVMNPLTHGPVQIGLENEFRIFKNYACNPTGDRKAKSYFNFEKMAYDRNQDILSNAMYLDLIRLAGSWYCMDLENEDIKAQGRTNALLYLDNHPEVALKLEKQIIPRRDELFKLSKSVIEKSGAILR